MALAASSIAALAQSAVIAARSGLVHYVEGQVYLGDQLVETKFGVFPEIKENQQLKTEEGRAEVLLTPGAFLRLGENSAVRLISNRLIDTRLEFLSGTAIVEAEDMGKDNSVTMAYRDATVHPLKKGIYRLDSGTGELRVFDGVAEVTAGDRTVEVRDGHLIEMDTLAVHKFDKTVTDALNRWSERRDGYVSMANVAAASSLRSSMFSGGNLFTNGWYYNPFVGMYSYVPGVGGMGYSPYGCPMFSPWDVYMAYMPGAYYPCYSGYPAYGYPNNIASAYNAAGYRTLPTPHRPIGGHGPYRPSGSAAGSQGASTGLSGTTTSVASHSSTSSAGNSGMSHGGGMGGSVGGGGGHH
ncbi:MAG TPA: hypothetical protein VMQ86_10400 [Bryobacteraceae bacterium]|nr:hypothetical protein [Bryobacteraceae bacterium]